MGWQKINSMIKAYADDVGYYYDDCEGYLVGTNNESGYYCFKKGPWSNNKPFISDTFYPHLVINRGSEQNLYLQDYTFNNSRVFKSVNNYIFHSNAESKWIYPVGTSNYGGVGPGLREPYYYTDIDDTLQGDFFYEGVFPETLNGEGVTWTLDGAIPENTSYPSEATVSLKQDIWIWKNNGDRNASRSGFCGKYQNEVDGTWKMVGVPVFGTNTEAAGAYVFRETFTRGSKDTHNHYLYEGDKGHLIHYKSGQWIMGTVGSGKWSEGDEPSLHSGDEVNFKGYEIDEGTGEQVPDPKGDFKITFQHCEMGNQKGQVLMGEVSIWRRSMNY